VSFCFSSPAEGLVFGGKEGGPYVFADVEVALEVRTIAVKADLAAAD
jgi:hypothetical protein